MSNKSAVTRRQVLGAGAVTVAALHPGVSQLTWASSGPDANEIYARARGAVGEDPGLWVYSGRLWGKPVNDQATNLFGVEGFSFNRMIRQSNGQLQQVMEECGFWQDPASGEVLDDWINPLNGLTCKAEHYRSRQALTFSPDGRVTDGSLFQGHITQATISGPKLWISEILHGTFPSKRQPGQDPLTYTGPVRTATSLVTYTMDASAALAEEAGYVPSTMNFQSMSSWYPWMRMGQAQGQIMFELFGRKIPTLDEIPAHLRDILDERRPGFLSNPNI
jgi:hypothetical protein